jgi:hypothetical protein
MESPYALQRGLFNTICTLFVFVATWRACTTPGRSSNVPRTVPQSTQDTRPQAHVSSPPRNPADSQVPRAKQYAIIPILPAGDDRPDYTFILKQCYRASDMIQCWGLMTNTTDAPRPTSLNDSRAIDDEGNSIFIGIFGGGFTFPGANSPFGTQQKLIPGVPTKFAVKINDAHRNVKSINLELHVSGGEPHRYDALVLKDVPVQ